MQLSELGERVCILGPSNSGKSTLATAIGRKLGLPVVHLDRLYHLPGTDWVPRPREDFTALHDEAIAGDRWVMDGNYSACMPQRFRRATGVIYLDASTTLSLCRYIRRTLFQSNRIGGLDGGADSLKWDMIRHIVVTTRRNRQRNTDTFESVLLPKIRLSSCAAIRKRCEEWGLDGPWSR